MTAGPATRSHRRNSPRSSPRNPRLAPDESGLRGYVERSRRPLHILLFLLPLIIAYELGLALLLRSEQRVLTIEAHRWLIHFFDVVGIARQTGLHLGGAAIVAVLVAWHLLRSDSWRLDGRTIGVMVLEAVMLTVPLLVLGRLLAETRLTGFAMTSLPLLAGSGAENAADGHPLAPLPALTISIGAGLYEELMFRMLLIAVLHTLAVDVFKTSHTAGATIAILVSAIAFTAYHPLQLADGSVSMQRLVFYFLAGLYFAGVYVLRGFGIVVAVHALYDVVTVMVLNSSASLN